MTDLDLTRWCQQSAAKYREYEHINMAAAEDRDVAIVKWVVRVLGNPELPESREVLRLLGLRHGAVRAPLPGTARMHPDDAAECERTEAYWRSQIAREVYAKADEIARVKVGGFRVGESTAQVIRAVADTIGRMPERPRVWPQDHATDVTVPGPVLTSEPGPEVTTVVDGDGDRWARRGGVWICADDADPLSWTDLSEIFGPIRSAL